MNMLTLTVIFLHLYFVVNYDFGQLSVMEDQNFEANEKFDDRELEALQDLSVGSNEKFDDQALEALQDESISSKEELKLQKSEFSEERNDNDKLNYLNLDSTNDDIDVTEPRTLVQKENKSNEKQDESDSQNRDVKVDQGMDEDADNVDKDEALDVEDSLAEEVDAENKELDKEMEKEREAGDAADLFGTNQHYNIPVNYEDFGRRFVLTYPYIEKKILSDVAESHLDNTVKQYLQSKKQSTKQITPMKAPPEFVLEIAKQSALLEASKPKNPADEIVQKDILRTGNYWNGVWKEEVDVDTILRTNNKKQNQLESISVNILPGSKLYQLISMLKHKSPRFIYVINKSNKIYDVLVHLSLIFHFGFRIVFERKKERKTLYTTYTINIYR